MENIKEYTARKKAELKKYIDGLEKKPKLVIIQVGNVEASNRYVKNKLKDCAECSLPAELLHYDETVTEEELLNKINELNNDAAVTGFICQLPLPKHISEDKVIEAINPLKDVDGFSKLAITTPATPTGAIDFLDEQGFEYKDKNAVVLGRSHILGAPLSQMLLAKNCNVTTLHSKTSEDNKKFYIENADLICACVGKRHLINASYRLKPTCVILDFGINFNDEGKLCGDCDKDLPVAFQSPVPGGLGLCTRLALITNLVKLYKIQNKVS